MLKCLKMSIRLKNAEIVSLTTGRHVIRCVLFLLYQFSIIDKPRLSSCCFPPGVFFASIIIISPQIICKFHLVKFQYILNKTNNSEIGLCKNSSVLLFLFIYLLKFVFDVIMLSLRVEFLQFIFLFILAYFINYINVSFAQKNISMFLYL